MASDEINIVAVITPNPGCEDRVISLLTTLAEAVMATEPNTLRFHVTEDDNGNVVVIESYRTQADCDSHASSDAYLEMTQEFQRERLIARAPTVMTLTSVAGFDHRL